MANIIEDFTKPVKGMFVPGDKGPDTIVSIKVQTTRLTGAGVEDIPMSDKEGKATHWSIYLRKADGGLVWVKDLDTGSGHSTSIANAYGSALVAAAKLSMQHKAFIELIK